MGEVIVGVSVFAFFGILAGLVVHHIIGLYLEGSIGGFQATMLIGFFVTLLTGIIATHSIAFRIILLVLIISSALLLRMLAGQSNRKGVSACNEEKMAQYRRAIAADPKNLAARIRLSEVLYEEGRLDEAIEELEELVSLSPKSEPEVWKLRRLEEERDERKSPPVICPNCSCRNPAGRKQCLRCGGELSVGREVAKWLKNGGLRQISITTGITMGICAVLLVAFNMLSVIGRVAAVALILLIVISAEYIYIQRNW